MNEINCPHCEKAFKVDTAGYADIIKQVRNHEFDKELTSRLSLAETDKQNAIQLAEATLKNSLQEELSKKEAEISNMKSQINVAQVNQKLAISEALKSIEKERDSLANEVKHQETEKHLLEKSIKEQFNNKLIIKDDTIKMKDDEIARLKDFKQKLSTKMVGETLEIHCETEFNKLRATAFQNAHFEKDNDSSGGSKGDFIYRENDDFGNEIISIMFEMKNENDETATKKRNEDFFNKLDKDRNDKKCEYAVLVSLLEADNEFYNTGIVDVSHRHEKMYVIRPQFFIPIITLLRNAAMKSLKYKQELNLMRNQNIDITNFEEKIDAFRTGFSSQ